jgi:hypothetical protein
MKIKLLLTFLLCLGAYTTSYASFPVERTKLDTTSENTTIADHSETTTYVSPAAAPAGRDKWVGVALWFFLWWPFAAHRWYYKKPVGWNILFILTIGGLGIWAIVDLINMLTDNF